MLDSETGKGAGTEKHELFGSPVDHENSEPGGSGVERLPARATRIVDPRDEFAALVPRRRGWFDTVGPGGDFGVRTFRCSSATL